MTTGHNGAATNCIERMCKSVIENKEKYHQWRSQIRKMVFEFFRGIIIQKCHGRGMQHTAGLQGTSEEAVRIALFTRLWTCAVEYFANVRGSLAHYRLERNLRVRRENASSKSATESESWVSWNHLLQILSSQIPVQPLTSARAASLPTLQKKTK